MTFSEECKRIDRIIALLAKQQNMIEEELRLCRELDREGSSRTANALRELRIRSSLVKG